ncbi:MAG: sugar ABC transporter permease [Propionivibrio sp.]|jgi:multiple sugar transport system permease protein|uniref:carbohydrate ABC transporter permease n=1 Tax=Propionivibrio sp. TaxID=2212460 RepID=UPI001B73926D|nr:sugar ABC transporter permease [Propionivibrio sp.]MBP7201668.1 sugar ABC transporter permease [Propionivibrio sp.]
MTPSEEIRGRSLARTAIGMAFISPWLLGFIALTAYPFFASLYFSFTKYSVLSPPQWVGLKNYSDLLSDSNVLVGTINTLYYTCFAAPGGAIIAVLLGVLYNQKMPAKHLLRALMFIPLVVPTVASAILWMEVFRPDSGMLNTILGLVGINGPAWLGDVDWSKAAMVIMMQWGVGGNTLLVLAALQDVPRSQYEAADLDGANAFQKFRHITLPMISPVVLYILIINVIYSFQFFTEPFVMSGGTGAPGDSLLFYPMYLYQQAFRFMNMGYASALAWMLFIVVLVFTVILVKTSAKWVVYERS